MDRNEKGKPAPVRGTKGSRGRKSKEIGVDCGEETVAHG